MGWTDHPNASRVTCITSFVSNYVVLMCAYRAFYLCRHRNAHTPYVKYNYFTPDNIIRQCQYLLESSQHKLHQLFSNFTCLFSGRLGHYVKRQFSIHLKNPNVIPIFCNLYPIPLIHQPVFRKGLDHLIKENVYKR